MFTDLIDSVSTSDTSLTQNFIKAEGFLYETLLNGYHPTLSLSQVLDSRVILNLAENNTTHDPFLETIEKGYIRIALYGNTSSLKHHLIQTLHNATNDTSINFKFSSMPFLYEKDKYSNAQQLAIYKALLTQLINGDPFLNAPVTKEDRDKLEQYIHTVDLLNAALNKAFRNGQAPLTSKAPCLLLSSQLSALIQKRLSLESNLETIELLKLLQDNCTSNRRTDYYNFLDCHSANFEKETLDETRQMIDFAYNQVVASSIYDDEYAKLHVPNQFSTLASSLSQTNETDRIIMQEHQIHTENNNSMDWNQLMTILTEVEAIYNEKNISWEMALQTYLTRQRSIPIKQSAQYLGITAITYLVSSIPFVGSVVSDLISNIVWSGACDTITEVCKKPGVLDIIKTCKESHNRVKTIQGATGQMGFWVNASC